MLKESKDFVRTCVTCLLLSLLCSPAWADWSESFNDKTFGLSTWQFLSYPTYTASFKHSIETGADANDYLVIEETTSADAGGSAFGIGIGAPEQFTDVRVGAVINAAGIAAQNYLGLAARVSILVDNGSISGHPGALATSYLMFIHYQEGPANFRIEVFKSINLSPAVMKTYHEVLVPGVAHARPYYAELDVVGSDPVYITGSMYAYKNGPLLARTPTLIDTHGADAWENAGVHDAVLTRGVSAIFSTNQSGSPVGYQATFDDVSSVTLTPAETHAMAVSVDDFEAYAESSDIEAAWVCNVQGFGYVSLEKNGNDEQMRLQYENQFEPYFTEATKTFATPSDWTLGGIGTLSLEFRGKVSNVAQPMSLLLEDTSGAIVTVDYPSVYAVQSRFWRTWEIDLNELTGIDLSSIGKMTLRVGDRTNTSLPDRADRDEILINDITLNPPE